MYSREWQDANEKAKERWGDGSPRRSPDPEDGSPRRLTLRAAAVMKLEQWSKERRKEAEEEQARLEEAERRFQDSRQLKEEHKIYMIAEGSWVEPRKDQKTWADVQKKLAELGDDVESLAENKQKVMEDTFFTPMKAAVVDHAKLSPPSYRANLAVKQRDELDTASTARQIQRAIDADTRWFDTGASWLPAADSTNSRWFAPEAVGPRAVMKRQPTAVELEWAAKARDGINKSARTYQKMTQGTRKDKWDSMSGRDLAVERSESQAFPGTQGIHTHVAEERKKLVGRRYFKADAE